MNIRPLQQNDGLPWRNLRLRMLREHPEAFGEHAEQFAERSDAEIAQRLVDGNLVGAFVNNELAGTAGWFLQKGAKRQHIGVIWGMYVAPEFRSRGIGGAILDQLLANIRDAGCDVAQLGVAEPNVIARELYESAGFKIWGREEDALRVDGKPVAIIHMWRML